jgi:hypothetical protein
MEQEAVGLTERELITEVIMPNLPKPWLTNFKLLKLNRKSRIREVLDELVVMEETIKMEKKQVNQQSGNKNIKNPCRLHNGTYEWADCRQNPKNGGNGNNQQKTNGQGQKRGGNNNGNNRNREEQRNTENDESRNRDTPVRGRRTADYDDEELLCIMERTEETMKKVSAKAPVAIPITKGSKKYITYLGLLDTRCSSSLIDSEIIDDTFDVNSSITKTKCRWFAHQVQYLSFNISREGISPQKEKIQGILNMAIPKTQKEVRRFVGLVNFTAICIPAELKS